MEDARALAVVSEYGCDEIQGYHVSRPLPAAEFMRWVNEWDPDAFGTETSEPVPAWPTRTTDPTDIVQSMS